jgi:hypothetical protein
MKDGGFQVPAGNIRKSFGSTLQAAARASTLVSQKWPELTGLVFHEREDWSFYGTVLAEGETITFGGLDLDSQATVVMASTDGQSSNIDLAVVESASGRALAADTEPDANPLVIFAPTKGQSYAAQITNVSSGGPSLVTTLILDAQ